MKRILIMGICVLALLAVIFAGCLGGDEEKEDKDTDGDGVFDSEDDYPEDSLVWNAQFLIGRNYEELLKSGLISASEAEPKIRAAYEQLLGMYPDCPAAKIARLWLDVHNSI